MDCSATELAWLAGILEGEGYFLMINAHKNGKVYRYPKIGVNMTDQDVIVRAATILGAGVYEVAPPRKYPTRKIQWRATLTGSPAANWMVRLAPLMGTRRNARISEILTEYAAQEPTEVRRRANCQAAAVGRARDSVTGQFLVTSTGECNGNAKLSNKQVREMRARYAEGGLTQKALAAEFGVSVDLIHKIVRMKLRRTA